MMSSNGYCPAAILMRQTIKEMRDHVEEEKFLCRILKDNETTREFKENTQKHENSIYRMNYNSESVQIYTKEGKLNGSK